MTKMARKLTYTEIEAIIIRVTKNPDIFVKVKTVDGMYRPAAWIDSAYHQSIQFSK